MPERYFRGRTGHGRIHEDGQVAWQPFLAHQIHEQIKQVLGATYRKGRDHDIALFSLQGIAHHKGKLLHRSLHALVQPVAIGAFHQQDIGLFYAGWVVQDWTPRHAQIAGEHELAGLLVLLDPDFNDGRAQNMPRIAIPDSNAGVGMEF